MHPRLRIAVITQGVNPVVRALLDSGRVIGVAESRWRGPDGFLPEPPAPRGLRQRLLALVRPPRYLGRFCHGRGVPYHYMSEGATSGFLAWLGGLRPDLLCVYSMSELLPPEALAIPRLGAINMHGSLLPAYRGPSVFWWELWDGATQAGATVHRLDAGEDTGPILQQQSFPLGEEDTLASVAARTAELGATLMLRAVEAIEDGTASEQPQPALSPTRRARRIRRAELPGLAPFGTWPAARLLRLFRADVLAPGDFDPSLAARAGDRWRCQILPLDGAEPGAIRPCDGGAEFACADARVRAERHTPSAEYFRRLLRGGA